MLTYSFTDIGSDSLYMHLYKCIKNDILEGKLCSGTKLPSKRSFAKNLALSNITVENAYAQLQAEGYIYSLPRKGFFVSDISNIEKSLSREEAIKHIARKNNLAQNMDLVSNKANPDYFPFSIWTKLMREVINKNDAELMTVSPAGGIFELRNAIFSLYQGNTYIQNSGIDFVYENEFNVISVLDGTVTNVKEDAILGKIVEITHDNDYISIYQSLGEVKVTKGDSVSQGQVIGISGTNEMDKDIGNHLHFEMYISGYNVNPINYLDKEVSKKN